MCCLSFFLCETTRTPTFTKPLLKCFEIIIINMNRECNCTAPERHFSNQKPPSWIENLFLSSTLRSEHVTFLDPMINVCSSAVFADTR